MDDLTTNILAVAHRLLDPADPYGMLLYGLLTIFLAWLVGRILGVAVERAVAAKHKPSDPTAIRFLGQLARLGVYIFAFVSYAHVIPALQKLGTAWLASVGVASVVLGMAAQNTLGNLIAGISLLLYRPFSIGDWVQVNSPNGVESGEVESLNLGYTILRTSDNRRIVIPNSTMASQTSINLSFSDPRILTVVPITISADADLDKARAILIELARQHSKTSGDVECPVTALTGGTVTLSLKVWCPDFPDATRYKYELLEAARQRFKTEGIELK
jgi:small conductance mechanosensitive channel